MWGRWQWADLVQKTWEYVSEAKLWVNFQVVREAKPLSPGVWFCWVLGGWQDGIKNFQFLPIWKVIKAPLQERKIWLTQVQSPKLCIKLKSKSGRAVSFPPQALDGSRCESSWIADFSYSERTAPRPAAFRDELSSGSSQLPSFPSIAEEIRAKKMVIPCQRESFLQLHPWLPSQRYIEQRGDFKVQIALIQTCLCTHAFTYAPLHRPDKFLALNMRFLQWAFSYMFRAVCLMFAT